MKRKAAAAVCPECGRPMTRKQTQRQLVLLRLEREYLRDRLTQLELAMGANVERRVGK